MIAVILLWLSTAYGQVAAPMAPIKVVLKGTVSEDLRTIHGTISAEDFAGLQWVDLLSKLPLPESDRLQQRTFTHVPEQGFVRMENPIPTGRPPTFHTVLPRRMGASGLVPGRGLFVNGLWHPHPILDGKSALVMWKVELKLPENAIGVLNGSVAIDTVRWSGVAERLSLAVIPKGRVQYQELSPTAHMTLIDRGLRRPLRDLRLKAIAMTGIDHLMAESFVVIETPSRRRLTRNGPNTLFLSDRAFRVSGRQWKNHLPIVRQGLYAASLGIWDPWSRDLIAGLTPPPKYQIDSLWEKLRWRSFLPRVDSLLYDGRSPFMSEVFEETWPSDPIRDDALEMVENPTPPTAAARKLERLYGEEVMRTWATTVIAGAHPDEASTVAEIPSTALSEWFTYPEPQDVSVQVNPSDDGWKITIQRDAAQGAPTEIIPFTVNDELRMWTSTSPKETLEIVRTQRPKKVHVDPDKEVLQSDRSNDAWPKPQTFTVAGSFSEINADQLRPNASLYMLSRRPYASPWIHGLILNTSAIERVGGGYSIGYGFGPLLDRRNHIWQAWMSPSVAWLDPDYDPKEPGGTATDWTVGIRKDTRDAWPISRQGHRLSIYGGNGWVWGQQKSWLSTGAQGSLLIPIGGTLVHANRVKIDATTATVPHRMLSLGGANSVQGLPSDHFRGQKRVSSSTELRFAPIRHASIPLWMLWVTHIQISASIDAGWNDGAAAAGWSGGLGFAADIFGRESSMLGIWVASAIWAHEAPPISDSPPQFYLRASQAF